MAVPSIISANSTIAQQALVGTAVATPPSVLVLDVDGLPFPDLQVTFVVDLGGGVVDPVGTILTDANGIATLASWTLGPVAGLNQVSAIAQFNVNGSPVVFQATGVGTLPLPVSSVEANSTLQQSAVVGSPVGTPPSVLVRDTAAAPKAGVFVQWTVTAGNGLIVVGNALTDANGVSSLTSWTVGPLQQINQVTATVIGATGSPVTFTALTSQGTAFRIRPVSVTQQDAQAGSPVPVLAKVIVEDQAGNPVPGVTVFWDITEGGGSRSPASSVTDSAGVATVTSWITGSAGGSALEDEFSPGGLTFDLPFDLAVDGSEGIAVIAHGITHQPLPTTRPSSTTVATTVSTDGIPVVVGVQYDFRAVLTPLAVHDFRRGGKGVRETAGRLLLRYLRLLVQDTGHLTVIVDGPDGLSFTYVFTRDTPPTEEILEVPLMGPREGTTITLFSSSTACATIGSYDWEGFFHARSQRLG